MSKNYKIAYVLLMLSVCVSALHRLSDSVVITVIAAALAAVSLVLFVLDIAAEAKKKKDGKD